MKKKNTQYSEEQAKLPVNIIYEHFRNAFSSVVGNFDPFAIDDDYFDIFSKDLYYPSKPLTIKDVGRDSFFLDIKPDEIGESEWELLAFSSNYRKISTNERIMFLLGKIGTGKPTLINYVYRYLCDRTSVKQKILPLIISCQDYYDQISESQEVAQLSNFVHKTIVMPRLSVLVKDIVNVDKKNFWNWYETHSPNSDYSAKLDDLRSMYTKDRLKGEVRKLRKDEKDKDDFYFSVIDYIKEKEDRYVTVVFDNLDPFDINIVKNFYWISKTYANKSKYVRIVMSIRNNTYYKVLANIKQVSIIKKLEHKVSLSNILSKRCDKLAQYVDKINNSPLTLIVEGKTILIKPEKLDEMFTKILKAIVSSDGRNYLYKFSKDNIRSQLELLTIIFSSGIIPKSIFGKIFLLNDSGEETYTIPTAFIVGAIVTFGYSTYFTSKSRELGIPGVINVLSCAYNESSVKISIKLFILRYLKNRRANFSKIKHDWCSVTKNIYDTDIVIDAFNYCITRLFNAGLIHSPDTPFIEDFNNHNDIHELSLSPLGDLYVEDLICNPEYLFFVKDDVYVNDTTSFEGSIEVFSNYPINKHYWISFLNIIYFLKQYGDMELGVLHKIRDFESLNDFIPLFATEDDPLITLYILKELKRKITTQKDMDGFIEKQIFDHRVPQELNNTINYFEERVKEIIN
ncbi:MAG: hypothetical protein LUH50_22890 [Bacteroides intestinalis]|nr:hypothetical protein [Bacteroides intestinalis]